MRQGFLAALGGRARLQSIERREAHIGHEMIGRWRETRADHALGLDTSCAHEPRPGVGQVLLAIGAVEFRGILRDGIENEQMGCHGMFLSLRVISREGYRRPADLCAVRNPDHQRWWDSPWQMILKVTMRLSQLHRVQNSSYLSCAQLVRCGRTDRG